MFKTDLLYSVTMSKDLWNTIASFILFEFEKEIEIQNQKTWQPDLGLGAKMQGSISDTYQNPAWVLLVMECRVVILFQMHSRQPCWALLWEGLQWLSVTNGINSNSFHDIKFSYYMTFAYFFLGLSAFLSLSIFTCLQAWTGTC